MTILHQPPKRTILRNCSQLWALKEWLSDEVDQSSWPLLRVIVKKRDCHRPFPCTGHKGNHCLWYINNPSNHFHYENDRSIWTIFWTEKCLFVRNLKPLSELESICPIWTFTKINNISILPPNWRVILITEINIFAYLLYPGESSLSAKGVISAIPIFSRKYANLILERGFVRISDVCSSVGIYSSFTSPS